MLEMEISILQEYLASWWVIVEGLGVQMTPCWLKLYNQL